MLAYWRSAGGAGVSHTHGVKQTRVPNPKSGQKVLVVVFFYLVRICPFGITVCLCFKMNLPKRIKFGARKRYCHKVEHFSTINDLLAVFIGKEKGWHAAVRCCERSRGGPFGHMFWKISSLTMIVPQMQKVCKIVVFLKLIFT